VYFLVLFCSFGNCSLLVKDKTNPCRAYGNGTTYDISNLFNWPIQITGPGNGGPYPYWWSCLGKGTACGDNVAVCQLASGIYWDGGDVPSALWLANYNPPANQWTMMYLTNGIRLSQITFIVDSNVANPTLTMNGENPYTQYDFTVTGKCIGQPQNGGFCNPMTGTTSFLIH